MKGTLKWWSL